MALPAPRGRFPATAPTALPGIAAPALRPSPVPPPAPSRPLRVALLAYRGNPHSGGQGVYVRHLSRALVGLGHSVEVLAGPPYPDVDAGVRLTALPSLDLYRADDPFRRPRREEFRDAVDVLEYGLMCTAGFPEPLTFSLRAWRALRDRAGEFDVVHDNQGLGYGLLGLSRRMPVVATVHHPVTVDRRLELEHATDRWRRLSLRRWYAFTAMQARVARRLPRILTVSSTSRDDVVRELGVAPQRIAVVPNGVDASVFRPLPHVERVPGRIITTASADVPLKGLAGLVEALAVVRRHRPEAHLLVVGRARPGGTVATAVERLGLQAAVRFVSGIDERHLVEEYAAAQVAVVPSLYEGFSLPAVEAMACGVALVASRAGALPEVVGRSGDSALLTRTGDTADLAEALVRLLDDAGRRRAMGAQARRRVLERYTWESAAAATAAEYAAVAAC